MAERGGKLIPVILSGGAGTRLWPMSREAHPKPFMRLSDGQSLLQKTWQRAIALPGVEEVLTVTNREYYFKSKDIYTGEGVPGASVPKAFLLEPFGRNTAPAIALAACWVAEYVGADATMLVLPADHLIREQEAFERAVMRAQFLAREGKLVTFGIAPDSPETGYGYIECGEWDISTESAPARRFVEKPEVSLAERYVASGKYLWNSGMFCFTAETMLMELEQHAPELLEQARCCWHASQADSHTLLELDHASFAAMPDISIDYAVLEKAQNVQVVRAGFDWSDIGSWRAVSELLPTDESGNRVVGEAVLVDVANSFIQSEQRLTAAIGIEDLVIIDSDDALLVAHRDRTQDVRQIVNQLKLNGHEAYRLHRTVSRPWGTYTVLEEGDRFKIKRIVVKPGASLSLQMHHHRSEHWVVVSGMATVVNGNCELLVNVNESTFIPAGRKHRLENPGVIDLVMIEVQSGDYVGEDDIVRFEDQYGRVDAILGEDGNS